MWEAIVWFLTLPFVFWGAIVCMSAWMVYAVVEEEIGLAIWPLLLGLFLANLKFESLNDALNYLLVHPFDLVLLFLTYMIIGTVWSLFKWYLYVQDSVKWNKGSRTPSIPKVSDNKNRIVSWIVLWIPSMLIWILHDPVRRLGNWIYDRLEQLYQGIVDRAYAKFEAK